jgi:DNA mismatch repair protein MLH1
MVPDLHTAPGASVLDNIGVVFGQSTRRELLPVSVSVGSDAAPASRAGAAAAGPASAAAIAEAHAPRFSVSGYVSNANFSMKRGVFILFINQRLVECGPLRKAVEAAYAEVLPKNTHPFVYLAVDLPTHHVDVNVHPTKREVSFLHQDEMVEAAVAAVAAVLQGANESRAFKTQTLLPIAPLLPAGGSGGGPLAQLGMSASTSSAAIGASGAAWAGGEEDDDALGDIDAVAGEDIAAAAASAAALAALEPSAAGSAPAFAFSASSSYRAGDASTDPTVKQRAGAGGGGAATATGTSGGPARARFALSSAQAALAGAPQKTVRVDASVGSLHAYLVTRDVGLQGHGQLAAGRSFVGDDEQAGTCGDADSHHHHDHGNGHGHAHSHAHAEDGMELEPGGTRPDEGGGGGGGVMPITSAASTMRQRQQQQQQQQQHSDSAHGGDTLSTQLLTRRAKRSRGAAGQAPQLTSVQDLLAAVAGDAHHGLAAMLRRHVFVGVVDRQLSLVQYNTKLLLVNHSQLARELLYQQALRLFGNAAPFELAPAQDVAELALLALEANGIGPEEQRLSMAAEVAALMLEKGPMLAEYFSIKVEAAPDDGPGNNDSLANNEGGPASGATPPRVLLTHLPRLLDGHTPQLIYLPDFIVALAYDVDWSTERECFHTVAQALAAFYAQLPPVPAPVPGADAEAVEASGEAAAVADAAAERYRSNPESIYWIVG